MGIFLADQTRVFLESMLMGAALALLFDVFRISRIALPTAAPVVFVEDVLFFITCGVVTFFLMLAALDGQVRFFVLIGELLGAVLYTCTLGRLVMGISKTIIKIVKAVVGFLFRFLLLPLWRIFYRIATLLMWPVRFVLNKGKKSGQKLKSHLQVRRNVLYNHCKDYLRKRIKRPKIPGEQLIDEETRQIP